MIMSQVSFKFSRPKKGEPIPLSHLAYARARARNKAHAQLLLALKESGISRADLARMLGKRPEQLTRWLGGPGNMTIDTLADILFATQGVMLDFTRDDVLAKPPRNHRGPDWMETPIVETPKQELSAPLLGDLVKGMRATVHIGAGKPPAPAASKPMILNTNDSLRKSGSAAA